MKTRESGMPSDELWRGYFRPEHVLAALGLTPHTRDVVDIGCGYGTFTLPAAAIARATVHAFDIDPEMVQITAAKAEAAGLANVRTSVRDLVTQGTGLPDGSVDYVMLFNLLHCEDPVAMLSEAARVLTPAPTGLVGVIHWNYDPATPRGPTMAIRPRPEQCIEWARRAGLTPSGPARIDLPPYHYGLKFARA